MSRQEKSWGRRWRRHLLRRIRNFLVAAIGPPLIRCWIGSLRIRWMNITYRKGRLPFRPSGIYVFWHQRMLALAGAFVNSGFRVLVSQHGDGEMIARVVALLGMQPIRGSSTRGGSRAVLEILRGKTSDVMIAITPDGPRGPRHRFQEGAVYLASRTGLPVFPVAVSFERFGKLPTWDQFIVPRPFTRALVRLGEAVRVPPDADRERIEAVRKALEETLRALTEATDANFSALYPHARTLRELVDIDSSMFR